MSEFEIHPIDARLSDPAFHLATEVFATSSTVHKALGIGVDAYRAYLRPSFSAMLSEGISLAALDQKTGAMLGCIIGTDIREQVQTDPPSGPFAAVAALTQRLTEHYMAQRNPAPGEALLVDMAAVSAEAGGRGVYRALREELQRKAKAHGWRYVVGELSSSATQHVVLKRMGHQAVAEIAFADFEWDYGRPFAGIHEPTSIILAEGQL